jgi:hypothetical protein
MVVPTHSLELIWKNYEAFENGVAAAAGSAGSSSAAAKQFAARVIGEQRPRFNAARMAYRERKRKMDGLDSSALPVPPGGCSCVRACMCLYVRACVHVCVCVHAAGVAGVLQGLHGLPAWFRGVCVGAYATVVGSGTRHAPLPLRCALVTATDTRHARLHARTPARPHARTHAHTHARTTHHTPGKGGLGQWEQAKLWKGFLEYERSNPQVWEV